MCITSPRERLIDFPNLQALRILGATKQNTFYNFRCTNFRTITPRTDNGRRRCWRKQTVHQQHSNSTFKPEFGMPHNSDCKATKETKHGVQRGTDKPSPTTIGKRRFEGGGIKQLRRRRESKSTKTVTHNPVRRLSAISSLEFSVQRPVYPPFSQ